jgi:hypothetical protein
MPLGLIRAKQIDPRKRVATLVRPARCEESRRTYVELLERDSDSANLAESGETPGSKNSVGAALHCEAARWRRSDDNLAGRRTPNAVRSEM